MIETAPGTLVATSCAACSATEAQELYPANFDVDALNAAVFSARRLPDGLHYRLVRCTGCGLVRSDPVAPADLLAHLYRESSFDYDDEVPYLRRTYGRYLAALDRFGARHGTLLEIGCGNGFFLDEALARGYADVRGVEPSAAAVRLAPARLRQRIVCDVMGGDLFAASSFDVACMFQVFDHVPDPKRLLTDLQQVLRPCGLVLCFNHNVEAISARLLGERSPMVDIEHTYLYSPATMRRLFEHAGFEVLHVGPARNDLSLAHLVRLLPLPRTFKRQALGALHGRALGRLRLSLPVGNLYLVARKPA